jgi:serine/threonine protein kinase
MIVEQTLTLVQFVHLRGLIHRDIKPNNLLLGSDEFPNSLYLIDFGISMAYRDSGTGRHIEISGHNPLQGTVRYASIAAMRGTEQSRRDDMEALGYTWVYLLRGSLPWQDLPADTKGEAFAKILQMKMATVPEVLCDGLPEEFSMYFQAVSKLRFNEEPDYGGFRLMFRDLFLREGFVYDYVYDWTQNLKPVRYGSVRVAKPVSPVQDVGPMRMSASVSRLSELLRPDHGWGGIVGQRSMDHASEGEPLPSNPRHPHFEGRRVALPKLMKRVTHV